MSARENSFYAVYVFNPNRHHSGSGSPNDLKVPLEKDVENSKASDTEDSSVCLSLVEANLDAEQETVVRCYLLKSLSAKENANFDNEGKYVSLKFSASSKQTFGCYYHLLSKNTGDSQYDEEQKINPSGACSVPKKHTFVVCLIGKADSVMESFCSELGAFCFRILPLLDEQGINNKSDVQKKLENWYFYCIQYIERCLQSFKEDSVLLLQSALHGKVNISCLDKDVQWDLERLMEACTLTDVLPAYASDYEFLNSALSDSEFEENVSISEINLEATSNNITADVSLGHSPFCLLWLDRLLSCNPSDPLNLRMLLENFRLKAIRDLNTLRRLLKQAEKDHYSLFKAYKFLVTSGYQDILLQHVRKEATITCSEDSVEIINFLSSFTKTKQQTE